MAGLTQIEIRYRYNPGFESLIAMVPAVIPLLLLMIPAILATLSVVREKELGSITNFYVTPVTRLEFLLGKQIPYVVLSMVNFLFSDRLRNLCLPRSVHRELSDLHACRLALCLRGDRHRPAHFVLHEEPGRGDLRHRGDHDDPRNELTRG